MRGSILKKSEGGCLMATIVHDCAGCGARHTAMNAVGVVRGYTGYSTWNVLLQCNACGRGAVAYVEGNGTTTDPTSIKGNIRDHRDYRVRAVHPSRTSASCPAHVPAEAAKDFLEGCDNLADRRFVSAIMMFRRALEIGLKLFTTEIDAWKLEKRIDKLAEARLITPDLQQWAHKIRLEGNDAVHELSAPTQEQAEELQLFTELVLLYLFTLPAKVKAGLRPPDPEAAE